MRCCWCEQDKLKPGTTACPHCGRIIANLLLPHTTLHGGRYHIEKALGQGGFGITYRAMDRELNRVVAIKEFFPKGQAHREAGSAKIVFNSIEGDAGMNARVDSFQREGQNLAKLEHPNIPTVYENFTENNTAYLVMAFVDGQSLKDKMPVRERTPEGKEKRQPLPQSEVRRIIEGLVSALATAHSEGVYRLDIKPENVLITAAGRPVLVDFGAARQGTTFNTSSLVALTPQYAPPELVTRQPYGPFTDIFELGMMLYQMLTGELPPDATSRLASAREAAWEPTGISEPWRALITAALRMEPAKRPSSINAW